MLKLFNDLVSTKKLITAIAACIIAMPAQADDIDVYNASAGTTHKPNVLFILDYSSSMKQDVQGNDLADEAASPLSRASILKAAVNNLIESNKGNINVGLGSLYASSASGIRWPISDLTADAHDFDPAIAEGTKTVADIISLQLETTEVQGRTATVNALAEAAAYFRGDDVLRENFSPDVTPEYEPDQWNGNEYADGNTLAAMPSSYTPSNAYEFNPGGVVNSFGYCSTYQYTGDECAGLAVYECEYIDAALADDGKNQTRCKYDHPDRFTTPTYNSPLVNECQSNFIILISDGSPSQQNDNPTLRNVLTHAGVSGGEPDNCADLTQTVFGSEVTGDCGPEILDYLATEGINPNIADSQVKTYTIGFGIEGPGKRYLELLAEEGQGKFYEANDPERLTQALDELLASITSGNRNFTEIAIDIDPAAYAHSNIIYLPLFEPSSNAAWQGNLKGYFLDEDGLVDINDDAATIVDTNGLRFSDTAQSFWSSIPDGNEALMGGANESITELPAEPNTRKMYTYLDGGDTDLAYSDAALISPDNDLITNKLLDKTDDAIREAALNWLANAPMGDPLHTKPVVINYDNRKVVFHMTNQGFIHAFDATTPTAPSNSSADVSGGKELFAFMPQELLANIPDLYMGTGGSDHIYGLDGAITRWHEDENDDNLVNGDDTLTLIFGMRRGGKSYYAIDVTDPTRPKFKWQITQGRGAFSRLAQTWSRASLITVNNGGTPERMLMFGGGYDATSVDGATTPTASRGNAVFLVNGDGELVWEVNHNTHSDMIYSIPSDLTVIDSDNNGMVDRVYFGDLGGQLWRIDFDNVQKKRKVYVTKLADVSNGDYQPIYYPPSIAANNYKGERFMSVSFGTGDRTQPLLEDTYNALYMLKDFDINVGVPAETFTTIEARDIYDATDNDIGSTNTNINSAAQSQLKASRGWSVFLEPGEKSLSQVLTFQGNFFATTFTPNPSYTASGDVDPCNFSTISNLYIMDLDTAQPVQIAADGSDSIEVDQRTRHNVLSENMTIPSSPILYFPPDSSQVQIFVGKETIASIALDINDVFWHAK